MRPNVALDANLLVLLVVGLTDAALISRHKRTREYMREDFEQLVAYLAQAARVVVTPNVLSEASNLLRQTDEGSSAAISQVFRAFIGAAQERYVPSKGAAERPEFIRLGVADCALLELGRADLLLLSVDVKLCLAAQAAGYPAQNFNHLRHY